MRLGWIVLTLLLCLIVGIVAANVEAGEITGFRVPPPQGNPTPHIEFETSEITPTGTVDISKEFTTFDPLDIIFRVSNDPNHTYTFTETITNKIPPELDGLGKLLNPFTDFHVEIGRLVNNKFVPDDGSFDIVKSKESTVPVFFGERQVNAPMNRLDFSQGVLPKDSKLEITFDLVVPSGEFVLRETATTGCQSPQLFQSAADSCPRPGAGAPEPSTLLLLGSGLVAIVLAGFRRKRFSNEGVRSQYCSVNSLRTGTSK